MQNKTKNLIIKYGQEVIIDDGTNEITSFAFIQPLRKDEQSALYGDYNNSDAEQYLYIGIPSNPLDDDGSMVIKSENQTYSIIKSESVQLSGKAVYERAVLEKQ